MSRVRRLPDNTDGGKECLEFGKPAIMAMVGAHLTVERLHQRFPFEDAKHPRQADIGLWVHDFTVTACEVERHCARISQNAPRTRSTGREIDAPVRTGDSNN